MLTALILSSSEDLRAARERFDNLSDTFAVCGEKATRAELMRLGLSIHDRRAVLAALRRL